MLPLSLLYMILAYTPPALGVVTPTNAASDFQSIQVGSPFNITWSGATGDVTIALLLATGTTVVTIGSALTGTSYIWMPSALSLTDTYTLQFVDSTLVTSRSTTFNVDEDRGAAARAASSSQISSTTTSASSLNLQTHTSSTRSIAPSTMTTSISSSRTTSPTTVSPSTSVTSTTASVSSHTKGLSAGAKAGISVGVAIGILLIISVMVLAFWIGRRSARKDAVREGNENGRKVNDMVKGGNGQGWPGWGKTAYDPGSTGSRNNLLKKGDGRNSRMGTMMTDGRSSRMDTATFTDGRSSRMDTMTMTDGRDSMMGAISPVSDGRISQIGTDGRTSRISVHTDGRTSRIGRFEFEDLTDSRGFSGGIRIVEMEDFKI